MNDREKQRLEDAKIEGMPEPMSREELALRGGDPVFERFIARMEAQRDEDNDHEPE